MIEWYFRSWKKLGWEETMAIWCFSIVAEAVLAPGVWSYSGADAGYTSSAFEMALCCRCKFARERSDRGREGDSERLLAAHTLGGSKTTVEKSGSVFGGQDRIEGRRAMCDKAQNLYASPRPRARIVQPLVPVVTIICTDGKANTSRALEYVSTSYAQE